MSANSVLSNIAAGMPELVLGKLQDLAAAAYFSRANGLSSMFQKLVLDATQSVAMPMFAKEWREGASLYQPFVKAAAYVTALGWSFFAGLALLADPAVRLLYGSQWDASITPTRLLAIAAFLGVPTALCPVALMAVGGMSTVLRNTAYLMFAQVLTVAVAAPFGIVAVAAGYSLVALLGLPIWIRSTRRAIHFSSRAFWAVMFKSAAVAAITAIAPLAAVATYGWHPVQVVASLAIALSGGPLLFLLAILMLNHPLKHEVLKLVHRTRSNAVSADRAG